MKKCIILIWLVLMKFTAVSCPACDQKQPKLLKGITHGAGPESNWDYLIISTVAVVVLFTLYFSIKWLVKPGEQGPDHIKRFILIQD